MIFEDRSIVMKKLDICIFEEKTFQAEGIANAKALGYQCVESVYGIGRGTVRKRALE